MQEQEAGGRLHRRRHGAGQASAWATPGRIISGGADTADAKLAIMEECGFTVTRNPSEMAKLLKALLK
jgi:succinyl-CoA synthetase alpha subunit